MKFKTVFFSVALFAAVVKLACAAETMTLSSRAFKEGEAIPEKYTCDGKDQSPPLRWSSAPRGTQSLVLIMEDPDAAKGLLTHWVLFNIPPTINNLPQGLPAIRVLANSERHGTNGKKTLGYFGPCPPSGNHRYYFKLYALGAAPLLDAGVTRDELFKWMEGRVLAEASLMGRYQRKKEV